MKKFVLVVLVIMVLLASGVTAVKAFEYPLAFRIAKIQVSAVGNFNFRVYSDSNAWLCQNGPYGANDYWAYVEESDSGAKEKIATLLTAYALGKRVLLTTEGVTVGSNTYCHIAEFSILD